MIIPGLILAADTLLRSLGGLPPGVTDGWAATIRGERFSYYSAHPTSGAALLVRSLDSTNAARWLSAPITADSSPRRRLVFLAAMDVTDPGQTPVRFWMSINGAHQLALPQPRDTAERWSVSGSDGIVLDFRRLLIDRFGDVHGVFTLDLPAALAPAGAPVTLEVHGESVGRMSWFILYTVSMQPTVAVHGEQLLERASGAGRQTIRLDAWHPLDTATVSVTVDGRPAGTHFLAAGATTFRIGVPAVRAATTLTLTVNEGLDSARFEALSLTPVVPREIWLINHSHLDIGYTDLQPVAQEKHWRAIDSALAFIERSRGNPEGARFRWNVEGLWPLQAYLEERPAADTARLLAAVRRGDVALSALYANLMTGLAGSEELIHLTDFARRLRRVSHVPVTMAMTSDVPGYTWGLVPALARVGVRYLSSGPNYIPGPNQDGDRIGYTLRAWGDRPFWWIGPGGRDSLLVMFAGRGYSWVNGWPRGRITLEDASVMNEYLEDLVSRGYPWDIVQVRVAIGGDNGYPDGRLADVVRQWNERYVSPRLVIGTLPRMFAAMERRHGRQLPRLRGDFTGYWEDGAVSTARENVLVRSSAARLVRAEALARRRRRPLARADVEAAWRDVLLWDEHTWGADRSISEPDAPETTGQWAIKLGFALSADSASRVLMERVGGEEEKSAPETSDIAGAAADSIWNGSVVVHVDRLTGALASARWRGRELVDRGRGGWNRYRYVRGRDSSLARDAGQARIEVIDSGPLAATLRVTTAAPGAVSLVREVTLRAGSDAVRLVTRLDKTAVREKESVHFAFPLAVPGGVVRMEQAFAVVRPDLDQAEGANRNLYPVQRWLDASNDEFGVTVVTPDMGLWELNGLTAEAFKQPDGREEWLRHSLPGTELVAYAMNNYWHTNFKADQPGPVTFRVVLVPHGRFDAAVATQTALAAALDRD